MQTDIRGLVERLELSSSRGMMPLFEALSNAIDAIEARGIGWSVGRIAIHILPIQDLIDEASNDWQVDGFEIADNGVGFTADNLVAFQKAHTRAKARTGGKGIGRFTYLKVFNSVRLTSVFESGSERLGRAFDFSIDKEVTGAEDCAASSEPLGTTLTARSMVDLYRAAWPKEHEAIGGRIVDHFLIRFAAGRMPSVTLSVPGQSPIELNQLFRDTVKQEVAELSVKVADEYFTLYVYRNRDGRSRHALSLCADGRQVTAVKLRDLLPELPERLVEEEQQAYTLKVLVTGMYFDKHASQERTSIAFRPNDTLAVEGELLPRDQFNEAVATSLRENLRGDLAITHKEKLDQIDEFVIKAPEYRALASPAYRKLLEERIPPGLSEEKLDEALLHVRREVEDRVRRDGNKLAVLAETTTLEDHKAEMSKLIGEMNEVGKAKLADYVAHRRVILNLLDANLKLSRKDQKYALERVLHQLVFPMGRTSREVFLEQQNLWILDERLCFHTILTSDRPLNTVPGLQDTSAKEPDILAHFYDNPVGVSEPGSGTVVIIEFKRPMLDNYTKDPCSQITLRFGEILAGEVDDIDGRRINPKNLRFMGYLIADLTPSLRKHVQMDYHEQSDGEGYFKPLANGKGFVELISYTKLLESAKQRNRMLFEKLGLQKN